eukprot:Blabericola_migrator_1__11857@NODE_721_length_6735_cov_131_696611_g519_i0_p6_GENE_NODE_721_length_6735_cov_131_696611_g519_i0NODE_721_length_6735_cov_131_696611_g519_i0_p6_ORF_typecomplete_len162_score0_01_NODE_721_length_6735_cov_131_696611_g519_i036294114
MVCYIQHIVHKSTLIRHGLLIRGEFPDVIHNEFVCMPSFRQVLNSYKFMSRFDKRYTVLNGPVVEASSEVDRVTSMRPCEDTRDGVPHSIVEGPQSTGTGAVTRHSQGWSDASCFFGWFETGRNHIPLLSMWITSRFRVRVRAAHNVKTSSTGSCYESWNS